MKSFPQYSSSVAAHCAFVLRLAFRYIPCVKLLNVLNVVLVFKFSCNMDTSLPTTMLLQLNIRLKLLIILKPKENRLLQSKLTDNGTFSNIQYNVVIN